MLASSLPEHEVPTSEEALKEYDQVISRRVRSNHTVQFLEDAAIHDWYRFVLAYPDHLVTDVIERFGIRKG